MELLHKKVTEFFNVYEELQKEKDALIKAQSVIDKDISEIYHEIEGTVFTHARQSHKMLLKLQTLLKTRRDIKGKVAVLLALTDSMNGNVAKAKGAYKTAKKKHDEIMAQLLSSINQNTKTEEVNSCECVIAEINVEESLENK
jgi:ribosomal protein L22